MSSFNNINDQSDAEITNFDHSIDSSEDEFMGDSDHDFSDEDIDRYSQSTSVEAVTHNEDVPASEGVNNPDDEPEESDDSDAKSAEKANKKAQLESAFEMDGPYKTTLLQRMAGNRKAMIGAGGVGLIVLVVGVLSFAGNFSQSDNYSHNTFTSDDTWGDDGWGNDAWGDDNWETADNQPDVTSYSNSGWSNDGEVVDSSPRAQHNEVLYEDSANSGDAAQAERRASAAEQKVSTLESELAKQAREIQQLERQLQQSLLSVSGVDELRQELRDGREALTMQSMRIEELELQLQQKRNSPTQSHESTTQAQSRASQVSANTTRKAKIESGDDIEVVSAVEGFGFFRRVEDKHEFTLEQGEGLRGWGTVSRITALGCIYIGSRAIEPKGGECR